MMRVDAIFRYPVKSLRGHALAEAEVEPIGLKGDRRWMVVDAGGQFQTIRQIPVMTQIAVEPAADGILLSHHGQGSCFAATPGDGAPEMAVRVWRDAVRARLASPEADAFLSAVLEKPVRLVHLADETARPVDPAFGAAGDHVSFADGFPLLLTTAESLADLNARLGRELSPLRFRPNLVIGGAEPWAEDTWREIAVGSVRFRVVKPCARCVVTTRDPLTGAQDDPREPLRTLGTFHRAHHGGVIFGQNIIPDGMGAIRVGDPVAVLAQGRSNLLPALETETVA